MRFFRFAVIAVLVMSLLSSCSSQDERQALRDYIKSVKERPTRQIDPLPEVKPYESFTYSAIDLRSPFVPPEPEKNIATLPADNGLRPDADRRKEPLETYPLDSLRMVGTLEQNHQVWAIVKDTDAVVHRVTIGNYMGQNHGKISLITEEKVKVIEIIPDGQGGWRERESELALIE